MASFLETARNLELAKTQRSEAEALLRKTNAELRRANQAAQEAKRGGQAGNLGAERLLVELSRSQAAAKRSLRDAMGNLKGLIRDFAALSDPRSAVSGFSDADPLLLLPVRIETRFKLSGPAIAGRNELLVRIYPDSCLIDTFEADLTEKELVSAKSFWVERWKANGDAGLQLAAWRALCASHGSGRARWIFKSYVPVNENAAPHGEDKSVPLVIASASPLDADSAAHAGIYWLAVWNARTDTEKLDAARSNLAGKLGEALAARVILEYAPINISERVLNSTQDIPAARVCFLEFPPDPHVRSSSWSSAPVADPMPDRFVLVLQNSGVKRELLGAAVRSPLFTGFDPAGVTGGVPSASSGALTFPDETRWMADFDEAVKAGMGFRVALTASEARSGFDRIYVIGLNLAIDASAGKARLETMLEHRLHSSAGFELVPQGTPTNNTEDGDSGFSRGEDPDSVHEAVTGDGLFKDLPDPLRKRDGQWLAEALGVDTALIKRVLHSDGLDQSHARAMNTALWPATIGYFMTSLLSPAFKDSEIDAVRDYFINHVSGRGAIPAIRIGRQPYGILPVTAHPQIAWLTRLGRGSPHRFVARLKPFLDELDNHWTSFAAGVAHVGDSQNPQDALLDILGLHPASAEFHYRYAQSTLQASNFLKLAGVAWGGLDEARDFKMAVGDILKEFGYSEASEPQIQNLLFHASQGILDGGIVSSNPPQPGFETEHQRYIEWLMKASRDSLEKLRLQDTLPGGRIPTALVYIMLRHALLLGYSDASRRLHSRDNSFDLKRLAALRQEEPLPHIRRSRPASLTAESKWEALLAVNPKITQDPRLSVANYITSRIGREIETQQIQEQIAALGALKGASREEVDRVFREHLDSCGYRLDAWQTGVVRHQLASMTASSARKGILLGAYGWLENIKPAARSLSPQPLSAKEALLIDPEGALPPLMRDSQNGGLIHAPSLNQAVTGSILRNAYMSADSDAERQSIGINLSSERVRNALQLMDGMRSGQSLNALLGYHFERGLHDRHADGESDQFILALRIALPLTSKRLRASKTKPGEEGKVAARNVVDGIRLIEQMRKTGNRTYPFELTLPAAGAQVVKVLSEEAQKLEDLHDALGDLILAESVHQSVQGNFDRVASSLDAFAKGEMPPEPDVIRTPSTGIAISHRVAVHLDAQPPKPSASASPRTHAEPAVNEWLKATFPAMNKIGCRVSWPDAVIPGMQREAFVTLDDLGISPIDLIFMWQAPDLAGFSDLDDLVMASVAAANAATLRPDNIVTIHYMDAPPNCISLFETAPLIKSLSALVKKSRPLRASDMMLEGEARPESDTAISLDSGRLAAARAKLSDLGSDIGQLSAVLSPLTEDPDQRHSALVTSIDMHSASASALLLRAGTFGIAQSRASTLSDAARNIFAALINAAGKISMDWNARLTRCETELAALALLPVAAPDSDRVGILRRAESELPTKAPVLAETLQQLQPAFAALKAAFEANLAAYEAIIATRGRSISALLASLDALIENPAFIVDSQTIADQRAAIFAFGKDIQQAVASAHAEVKKRLSNADERLALAASAQQPADAAARVADAAKALFGEDFVVVPSFDPGSAAAQEFELALAASKRGDLFQHLTKELDIPFPVDEWLYGIARVREPMRHMENAIMLTEAFSSAPPLLNAMQLPFRNDDRWLGLEYPETYDIDGSRLLYSAHFAAPAPAGERLCGLLIDEWSEVLPGIRCEPGVAPQSIHTQTTGVAFHFDRPNAEAPQSWLLVTPATWDGKWHWSDIVGALDSTWDMARKRAVEPKQIDTSALAQFLPATVMATGARDVTIIAVLAANIGVARFMKD